MQENPQQAFTVETSKDPHFEQLDTIWQASKFGKLLVRSLQAHLLQHHLSSCRLVRYRYRPGQRSIVLYELNLQQLADGHTSTHWITGTVHADAGRMYKQFRKLLRQFKRNKLSIVNEHFSPLPLCFFLHDVDMLVQQYPFDRHLPQLHVFYTGEIGNTKNRTAPTAQNLIPHRYRPFLSATVERRSVKGKAAPEYYKFYRQSCARKHFLFLQKLYHCNHGKSTQFRLLAPKRLDDELHAIVFTHAGGNGIDSLLSTDDINVTQLAKTTAASLLAFHTPAVIPDRIRTINDSLEKATRALTFIQNADERYAQQLRSKLASIEPLFNVLIEPKATHLDMKPEHILIGTQTTLIDLDSSAMSDPVADIAMMCVRLQALQECGHLSAPRCNTFVQAFLEDYFFSAPPNWRITLPLHLRLSWLKVCLFYVQHALPHWQQRTHDLWLQAIELEHDWAISAV